MNSLPDIVITVCGAISTICFLCQYLPQLYMNSQRKSMQGLSFTGILVKFVGASFLLVNAIVISEKYTVIMYGTVQMFQYSVFIFQFAIYDGKPQYYRTFALVLLPIVLALALPISIPVTNFVKPISQVISHFPQLVVCWRMRTTMGVSLLSQHFNFLGGLFGFLVPVKVWTTSLSFVNSIFQALTLYALAAMFKELMPWQRRTRQDAHAVHAGRGLTVDQ
eukprot:TRINITY_DN14430_c0_g1_i1.p1 TRINITY_DN14430_c0_g1~~TRINITY_DN14430_c0_g1_i1.p1  ORF type:complete len:221 (+),score=15.05 TRINITY_DN14430_c0_g1_i1:54-716(+)